MAGRIYWSDSVSKTIKRANLDGTGIETIVTALNMLNIAIVPDLTSAAPGDMNGDGVVDGDDLPDFISRIIGS